MSRYPAISHSFILREISELRNHGIAIEVASINSPDRDLSSLTAEERREAEGTFYVKEAGLADAIASHFGMLWSRPTNYLAGLFYALRLGSTDIRKMLLCCFYFVEAVMIARWMRQHALSHLHVHFATPAATVALILSRTAPVGFSLTIHGPDEFYDVPGYYLPEKISSACFVCAISLYTRSQLMRIAPVEQWNKLEVTPLGVSLGQFEPRPFRESSKPLEILCVGRLVPAKGQHILLAAIAKLLAFDRPVLLRLVGDGPDRSSLERESTRLKVERAVRFEGASDQEQTGKFYETADVFALPSFGEGVPVALMEAMAMEIPCVTTWINGIPELIRTEVDGLLVAPSDADALAQALCRLMDDAGLRRRLGKAGRRRIEERYDLARNAAHLARVFHRRLGEHTWPG